MTKTNLAYLLIISSLSGYFVGYYFGKKERPMAFPKLAPGYVIQSHNGEWEYWRIVDGEDFYQAVRRCWRCGQKKSVNVHQILMDSEQPIIQNLLRKQSEADRMAAEKERKLP